MKHTIFAILFFPILCLDAFALLPTPKNTEMECVESLAMFLGVDPLPHKTQQFQGLGTRDSGDSCEVSIDYDRFVGIGNEDRAVLILDHSDSPLRDLTVIFNDDLFDQGILRCLKNKNTFVYEGEIQEHFGQGQRYRYTFSADKNKGLYDIMSTTVRQIPGWFDQESTSEYTGICKDIKFWKFKQMR